MTGRSTGIMLISMALLVGGASPARRTGTTCSHHDHGFWNDVVRFDVPVDALRRGANTIELRRLTRLDRSGPACPRGVPSNVE